MEHAKVTKYSNLFHNLRKEFDGRKLEMCHKVTFPEEEDFILVTLEKKTLHSPPVAKVLASGEETLATLQDSLELLTHRVPCMRKRRKIPALVHLEKSNHHSYQQLETPLCRLEELLCSGKRFPHIA